MSWAPQDSVTSAAAAAGGPNWRTPSSRAPGSRVPDSRVPDSSAPSVAEQVPSLMIASPVGLPAIHPEV